MEQKLQASKINTRTLELMKQNYSEERSRMSSGEITQTLVDDIKQKK